MVDGKNKNLAPSHICDRRAVKHGSRGLQPTVKTVLNFVSHRDIGTGSQNSTQQISIIHRQIMPSHKLSVFGLERRFFMMLPLASDVLNRICHIRNDGLSGTLFRCRYATQYSSVFRIRGLKPSATVLDRAAVDLPHAN